MEGVGKWAGQEQSPFWMACSEEFWVAADHWQEAKQALSNPSGGAALGDFWLDQVILQ